ncbi:MAG: hypothetical protein ACTHKU_00955, partial [Verrucomicrobiota bacterium]
MPIQEPASPERAHWHSSRYANLWKGIQTMTKQLETVNEVVRNDKHPFRKTDHQPRKALKNR